MNEESSFHWLTSGDGLYCKSNSEPLTYGDIKQLYTLLKHPLPALMASNTCNDNDVIYGTNKSAAHFIDTLEEVSFIGHQAKTLVETYFTEVKFEK